MAASFLSAGHNSVFTVGAQCGEGGTAMEDKISYTSPPGPDWRPGIPIGPHCWRMTAHPIIIDTSYMSQMQAMMTVNLDFATNGNQPSVPNYTALPGGPNLVA